MNNEERFKIWLDKVCQRFMPTLETPMERIRMFARELAEGAAKEFWKAQFNLYYTTVDNIFGVFAPNSDALNSYLGLRWQNSIPKQELLEKNGYLSLVEVTLRGFDYEITKLAFDLLQEINPTSIFISYRRKDSSAFALLILKYLKEHGLDAFVDMALIPGEDWHAGLRERIEGYDFLILVLGKETLSSEFVLDEVSWAMDAGLTIIPVWHNDFEYRPAEWENIPAKVDKLLQNTHAIRVREESALDYNTAIVEMLNRFGVTP